MQTLILLDRLGKELLPLTDNTPVALLPVAAKPLLDYTLEAIAAAGIKQALLVTGPHSEQVQTYVGTGQRWGLQLEYWIGRGEEDTATLLRQIPPPRGFRMADVAGRRVDRPSAAYFPAGGPRAPGDRAPCRD